MDDEFAKPRNAENDLAEIIARLGEPEATYRTNMQSVAWRFSLGVLIVVLAGILHYLMWSGAVGWPKGSIKLWIVIVGAMLIGPGLGIYLITFAVRGMKLWVLAYPTGLFVWHRGRVVGFPWDEIRAVQIVGMPDKAILSYPVEPDESFWFELLKSRRRVFGTTITLTRGDGEQISLPSTLTDFADLGKRAQEQTYRRLFPGMWAEFQDGRTLEFGALKCDAGGIIVGKKRLPWAELEAVVRESDKLEVRQIGKTRAWAKCELNGMVNLHVLMGVVAAARLALGPDGTQR